MHIDNNMLMAKNPIGASCNAFRNNVGWSLKNPQILDITTVSDLMYWPIPVDMRREFVAEVKRRIREKIMVSFHQVQIISNFIISVEQPLNL